MSQIKLKETLTLSFNDANQTNFRRISFPTSSKTNFRNSNAVQALPKLGGNKDINVRRPRPHQIIPYQVKHQEYDPKPWAFVQMVTRKSMRRLKSNKSQYKRRVKSEQESNCLEMSGILLHKYAKRKCRRLSKQEATVKYEKTISFNVSNSNTESSVETLRSSLLNYMTQANTKLTNFSKQKYHSISYQDNLLRRMQGRIKWKGKVIEYIKNSLHQIKTATSPQYWQ